MKYIREVSPLFKKPSMVADLPWEGTRSHSPSFSGDELPKHGPSTKDRKVIPLKMSFITRNLTIPDLENRCVCVCLCLCVCYIQREHLFVLQERPSRVLYVDYNWMYVDLHSQ